MTPSPQTFRLGDVLEVRRMGFGAMRVTGPGVWGPPADRAAALALLRRVVELGINLIDTADAYGPEVSEDLIAEALHPYPDDLVIATKGGLERGGPDDWRSNGRPEHLRAACEASLRRLRLERIDLYQLHAVDDDVPLEESLGELVELQREGKIRLLGVSNVDVDQLARGRQVADLVSVQNKYNLGFTAKSDPVLEVCARDGLGFIPWYPLDAGNLSQQRGRALARIAAAHDATPAQIALAWLMHRSPVVLPIPGTSSIDHLEENTAAAQLELSEQEMAELAGDTPS